MRPISPFDFCDPDISEDTGLFRKGLTQVRVQLTPRIGENGRGDWIVSAILPQGQEVEVVFAGRRAAAAKPLKQELLSMWLLECQRVSRKGKKTADPRDVRLSVLIEGGWRTIFNRDYAGMETRRFQLIAARWTYVTADHNVEVAGEPVRRIADHQMNLTIRRPARVTQEGYPADIIL